MTHTLQAASISEWVTICSAKVSSGGGWLLQLSMVVAHGLQMAQGSDVRRWLGGQNPAGLAEGHQATIRNRASGLSPVFC